MFSPVLVKKGIILLETFANGMHISSDTFTDGWYHGFIYYFQVWISFFIKQGELCSIAGLEFTEMCMGSAFLALGLKAILKFG